MERALQVHLVFASLREEHQGIEPKVSKGRWVLTRELKERR